MLVEGASCSQWVIVLASGAAEEPKTYIKEAKKLNSPPVIYNYFGKIRNYFTPC